MYGLLFLALFAIVEFGLAFKDWTSVTHAARAGARAGATFGSNEAADILVLREVQEILVPNGMPVGTEVTIYNASGSEDTVYQFDPGTNCDEDPGVDLDWDCCDWTPCPEPERPIYDPICDPDCAPEWPVSTRDVEAPGTDRIGVAIDYTHDWVTGFFTGPLDLSTSADFQIEPELFGPAA